MQGYPTDMGNILYIEYFTIYRSLFLNLELYFYIQNSIYSILLCLKFYSLFQPSLRSAITIIISTPLGHDHDHDHYYHSARPWPSLLVLRLTITMIMIIISTSLGHDFLSYSSLIWEISYTMKYPCIYQEFPRPFHDIINFPSHIFIRGLV